VPVSNDGGDIEDMIKASREKLGALDTAGALDVLQAKLDEEEQERTRRRVPLLKESARQSSVWPSIMTPRRKLWPKSHASRRTTSGPLSTSAIFT
jgi:hypothetical protein